MALHRPSTVRSAAFRRSALSFENAILLEGRHDLGAPFLEAPRPRVATLRLRLEASRRAPRRVPADHRGHRHAEAPGRGPPAPSGIDRRESRARRSIDSGLPISLPPDLPLEQRIRTRAPWESPSTIQNGREPL